MNNAAEIRHLTKAYGNHTVVDNLSFNIPTGHVVGLIGPNGAGKTTTMKMLLGLVAPTGGDVDLLGTPVGSSGWGQTLKRVGSMIEDPPIYDRMSARENLRYQFLAVTGSVDDTEIDRLLKLVDLHERADERPRGYSLGMKQRLGIATSLVGKPDLVILDEPANGLDPAGIREIRTLLRRLPEEGATVLVSSHQLAEVQQACDQLVILANGALIAQGTTHAILESRTSSHFLISVPPGNEASAVAALEASGTRVVHTNNTELTVEPASSVDGSALNRTLAAAGIYASELTRPTVSLEDAFLEMTANIQEKSQ